jgi:hypothetical protein
LGIFIILSMGKIRKYTMILMFSLKISLCSSQTCVVQLEEKDKYEIEKKEER